MSQCQPISETPSINTQGKDTAFIDEEMNRQDDLSAIKWDHPQPVKQVLAPVLPLTPDMIPEPLRDWLTDIAHRMKCPIDFVASAAIVMISSLIGTRLTIQPKKNDDWRVTPNLWGAVIGDPSTFKTPSVSEVFKFLNRLIAEEQKIFKQQMRSYETEMITYEAQKKVYASQELQRTKGKVVNDPIEYPQQPVKPTERRFMTNDATVEKIGELLNENPTGLLQFRDELIGLLSSWNKLGREQDRTFYLESWNGKSGMTVDRIGRGTTHIDCVCLSLFGGIQPAKLAGYLQAAAGYENDGFVQRLQLAVYPDNAPWGYVDEYPDTKSKNRAFEVIRKIVDSDFLSISYEPDEFHNFPYTRFDSSAQETFKEWSIYWHTKVLPNESGLLDEHFGKYRSLMPSLALIFHVINCMAEPEPSTSTEKQLVSDQATKMAITWCNYLQSHARRIYGLLDTLNLTAARELLSHLKKGDLIDGFKVRDIQRRGWSNLIAPETINLAISELIARGWLKEVKPQPSQGGRPESPHYLIHPHVLAKNEE